MNGIVLQIALAAIPAIFAIIFHEVAHGYAALALGDDTARRAGRLSLNPFRHIDPIGTILVPAILLILRTGFLFGWAKPVPVAAWKLKNPRRGMMLVACAGPAMNFFLAWLGALALHLRSWLPPGPAELLTAGLVAFIGFNLVLGLFNLLPIPPLDGGRIVVGLLPEPLALRWARLERAGIFIVLAVVFLLPAVLRQFGVQFDPVNAALSGVVFRGIALMLNLAGVHDLA